MKFKVKGVAMNRNTRKQVGKIRTEIIDTETNELFYGIFQPLQVERKYESFWNYLNPNSKEIVKVIDVRKV